jgi:hypothetical protein
MSELQTIKATQDTSASVEPKQEETRVETQIQRREPIMQFTSQEQLEESLKEWQERLGLRDWAIKAIIVDKPSDGDSYTCGLNTRLPGEKECLIELKKGVIDSKFSGIVIKKRPRLV